MCIISIISILREELNLKLLPIISFEFHLFRNSKQIIFFTYNKIYYRYYYYYYNCCYIAKKIISY